MVAVHDSRLHYARRARTSSVTVIGHLARFECEFFEVVAAVDLRGTAKETGAGYRLGWTQLEWIETNRATYRGLAKADGWMQVKRDRPPARPAQACRDVSYPTDPFTFLPGAQQLAHYSPQQPLNLDLAGVAHLPATVRVSHADSPRESWQLQRINGQTGKPNYLDWAQMEFHFCTVLMIQRQDGTFHQLKHFYWNVHWNVNFTHTPVAGSTGVIVFPTPQSEKGRMRFGPFIEGAVTDGRFAPLIAAPNVTTCNVVAHQQVMNEIVGQGVHR